MRTAQGRKKKERRSWNGHAACLAISRLWGGGHSLGRTGPWHRPVEVVSGLSFMPFGVGSVCYLSRGIDFPGGCPERETISSQPGCELSGLPSEPTVPPIPDDSGGRAIIIIEEQRAASGACCPAFVARLGPAEVGREADWRLPHSSPAPDRFSCSRCFSNPEQLSPDASRKYLVYGIR